MKRKVKHLEMWAWRFRSGVLAYPQASIGIPCGNPVSWDYSKKKWKQSCGRWVRISLRERV